METKALLSVPEFCARYGLSRSLAYELMSRGDIRPRKIGRLTRIAVTDADAWAASLPVGLGASSANSSDQPGARKSRTS